MRDGIPRNGGRRAMADGRQLTAAERVLSRGLFRTGAALPRLREPIERMGRIADASVRGIATDGVNLFYNPGAVVDDPTVEHLLIHCLYRHLPAPDRAIRPLWDLACDMSAEYLRTMRFSPADAADTRQEIADALPEGVDPCDPQAVCRALMDLFEDELESLFTRFRRDDHRYWYAPPGRDLFGDIPAAKPGDPAEAAGYVSFYGQEDDPPYREWLEEALANRWPSEDELPGGRETTGRYGLTPGSREERMLLRQAGKYDFTRYLRRYATTREEVRLDLGGFDYIPYYYGLMRYGNLPMIEPLESAELSRVEELVIAIDTSGSCSLPLVERFFGEIDRILMRSDCFFARMNVHIVQCDAFVQSHVAIHTLEEWRRYTREITIRGRGGTSFIPVFELVEQLRQRGALKHLKGLMYFTDGDGAYPRKRTSYETAFVFATRRALRFDIPEWIVPLCLERAGVDDIWIED